MPNFPFFLGRTDRCVGLGVELHGQDPLAAIQPRFRPDSHAGPRLLRLETRLIGCRNHFFQRRVYLE